MELNEMEKKLLFQVEGDYQTKILRSEERRVGKECRL